MSFREVNGLTANNAERKRLVEVETIGGDRILMTPVELRVAIKDAVAIEYEALLQDKSYDLAISKKIDEKFEYIEKSLLAYVDYKFSMVAEKVCEVLITRHFNEEVNRRVIKRLEERGKF